MGMLAVLSSTEIGPHPKRAEKGGGVVSGSPITPHGLRRSGTGRPTNLEATLQSVVHNLNVDRFRVFALIFFSTCYRENRAGGLFPYEKYETINGKY